MVYLFAALLMTAGFVKAQDVIIDFGNEQQIIRGFGGINFPAWIGDLNQDMREKAFSNNPGSMGLSILRMQVPPDATQFYRELETAEYAKSQGAIIFASPWNPPSSMKVLLKETNNGTDYVIPQERYPDYVDHLNSFVSYMEENNLPLYAISVQNEPDWHGWTVWTPQQLLTFMRENAKDINCRLISPESLQYRRSTFDPLLKDSIANAEIDILGTHLYGTKESDYYYPLAYEKNKEIWMTEHLWGSDSPEINDWDMALDVADEINLCMDAQMSAFVYWYIRRFYGLISDDGNITDKGYVMSQFSKFIRPGFHRVEAEFKPISNVTATAYKSDTDMVIVVVNQNNEPVDLNLLLQNNNLPIESLTQFTSSESKKMVNDGNIEISAESIAITVDGKSITTFTSNPENAARYGNQAPIAYLGAEVNIEIENIENVIQIEYDLLGSESTDTDGEILKYSWAKDGEQISLEPDLSLSLGIGKHSYVLTVTDNDGATATSNITIDVTTNSTEEIWLEAECAMVSENWEVKDDDEASNEKSVGVILGTQATGEAIAVEALNYQFDVAEGGTYKIWGRVLAPSYDDDSYWVKVDDGEWIMWNGLAENSGWAWNDVHDGSAVEMLYALEVGEHTLSVCYREDGASLDKFYITNTGKLPEGLGGDADNCMEDKTDITDLNLKNKIKIYPNPVQEELCVESTIPFDIIELIDINGKSVLIKNYTVPVCKDNLNISVENGVYFIKLSDKDRSLYSRFVVSK